MESITEFFCPYCHSDLSEQVGFDPDGDFWVCKHCGEDLYGKKASFDEQNESIVWHCDSCNDILNSQKGFSVHNGVWECSKCQFVNRISSEYILHSKNATCNDLKGLDDLKKLSNKLETYKNTSKTVADITERIEEIEESVGLRLRDFDNEHKEQFISLLVQKPKRIPIWMKVLSGFVLLFFSIPIFVYDARKYKKAMKIYEEEYLIAETEYFEKYKEERAKLLLLDDEERLIATQELKTELTNALLKQKRAYEILQMDNTIPEKIKNVDDVAALIQFYEDGRVETIKEAINLLFDEKRKAEEALKQEEYRQEMLKMQREQLEAAEEAAYYARQAARDSEMALREARRSNYD